VDSNGEGGHAEGMSPHRVIIHVLENADVKGVDHACIRLGQDTRECVDDDCALPWAKKILS